MVFLAARVEAPIEAFLVEVGDRVEAGEVIARLDAERLRALRDLAAARLEQVKAQHRTAEANLALARQELERMAGLKKSAAFSQAKHDDAEQRVAAAKSAVGQAEAEIGVAEAQLRIAQLNLEDTEVRAPYHGAVTRRLTEAGAYVSIGEPLIHMVADTELEIEADVPFKRISGLVPGATVTVRLDDGSEHAAEVRALVPVENQMTRTRTVRLIPKFDEAAERLADGQSVVIEVPIGTPRDVVTVHKDAIIRQGETALVYVVKDGKAAIRPVSLGDAVGTRFEVLSNLVPGDAVVIRGNERLRDGQMVNIDGDTG